MSKWINNLRTWQRIGIAAFFGNLGVILWVLPFWLPAKEMVRPTGLETQWSNIHTMFIVFGTIAIGVSLKLARIEKLFNLGVGFFSRFTGKQKGGDS